MPPIEEKALEDPGKPTTIGIIYPPPEVRNIVDKTASFVARNGPEFESRIRQNEVNNPKFNFLNPNDPYNTYYQHKVKEFKEGRGQEPAAPKIGHSLGIQRQQPEQPKIQEIIPKEPPPEFEFIADPPSISAFDLDVVKLTAQFVARNGRQFLTNLMNREKNYQFDFLRPQHSLFTYFTKLVEQYTKVLIPPKDLLPKLRKESDSTKEVLDQVKYRVEWAKFQERERRKEEEALERERVSYAQIDWHDFVVVETVDFQPGEIGNFPPPTTPEEVGARLLASERFETSNQEDQTIEMDVESDDEDGHRPDNNQIQDMDQDSDTEMEDARPQAPAPPPPAPSERPPQPPLPPMPDQVIIRKDYNPKAAKVVHAMPAPDQYLISPITGEKIPADKIEEHMRIGLLDPKWVEEQSKTIIKGPGQEEVYAPGTSIGSSLKQLAERRTDIFGSGAEEAQIGKKIGEEEKKTKEKVIWDGHTASMERVTQKARENISIEEQIAVIHRTKGLLPDEEKEKIGPAMPHGGSGPPLPPQSVMSHGAPPKPPMSAPKMAMTPIRPPMPPQVVTVPAQRVMMMPPRPPPPPMAVRPPVVSIAPPMPPMPPMAMQRPSYMQGAPMVPRPPPQKQMQEAPPGDEPPTKKAKTEESLIPENEFLKKNKVPVTFKVVVPNMPDKSEWKLNGQTLTYTLPLTDSVAVLKAKLHEDLAMPAGKQKLQYDGLFIKDSNSLAYYNFVKNGMVQLQLKERGGRKK